MTIAPVRQYVPLIVSPSMHVELMAMEYPDDPHWQRMQRRNRLESLKRRLLDPSYRMSGHRNERPLATLAAAERPC